MTISRAEHENAIKLVPVPNVPAPFQIQKIQIQVKPYSPQESNRQAIWPAATIRWELPVEATLRLQGQFPVFQFWHFCRLHQPAQVPGDCPHRNAKSLQHRPCANATPRLRGAEKRLQFQQNGPRFLPHRETSRENTPLPDAAQGWHGAGSADHR